MKKKNNLFKILGIIFLFFSFSVHSILENQNLKIFYLLF